MNGIIRLYRFKYDLTDQNLEISEILYTKYVANGSNYIIY